MRRNIALEIGDLFGAFIDEQRNQFDVRMIVLDAVGNVLQQHGFACFWRRDDEAARSKTNGAKQIDQSTRRRTALVFEGDARLRIKRRVVSKLPTRRIRLGSDPFDGNDTLDCRVRHARAAPTMLGSTNYRFGNDLLRLTQFVLLHHREWNDGVVRR